MMTMMKLSVAAALAITFASGCAFDIPVETTDDPSLDGQAVYEVSEQELSQLAYDADLQDLVVLERAEIALTRDMTRLLIPNQCSIDEPCNPGAVCVATTLGQFCVIEIHNNQ